MMLEYMRENLPNIFVPGIQMPLLQSQLLHLVQKQMDGQRYNSYHLFLQLF